MLERLFGGERRSTLLDSAFSDISRMLAQSARMLDVALDSLLENQPLEQDLEHLDDVVDEGERMVRRTVLEHLTIRPGDDLVASLVLVSLVQDAERIGDFARGLAQLVPLARTDREGPFRDRLQQIAARIRPLFADSAKAFETDDAAIAKSIIQRCLEAKTELQSYFVDVSGSDLDANSAVLYATASRMLRRIAAHLSNICSSVSQPFDRIRHGDEEA